MRFLQKILQSTMSRKTSRGIHNGGSILSCPNHRGKAAISPMKNTHTHELFKKLPLSRYLDRSARVEGRLKYFFLCIFSTIPLKLGVNCHPFENNGAQCCHVRIFITKTNYVWKLHWPSGTLLYAVQQIELSCIAYHIQLFIHSNEY